MSTLYIFITFSLYYLVLELELRTRLKIPEDPSPHHSPLQHRLSPLDRRVYCRSKGSPWHDVSLAALFDGIFLCNQGKVCAGVYVPLGRGGVHGHLQTLQQLNDRRDHMWLLFFRMSSVLLLKYLLVIPFHLTYKPASQTGASVCAAGAALYAVLFIFCWWASRSPFYLYLVPSFGSENPC